MSKRGSYLGGHTVVRHKKRWQYEAALAAAATDEQKRAALQQAIHDKLETARREKALDRVTAFDIQAKASAAARRSRRPKHNRKTPSVELLKNQSL